MSTAAKPGFQSTPGAVVLVTGSSGLVGARLVEILLERGASHVICLDLLKPDAVLEERFRVATQGKPDKISILSGPDGDITSQDAVNRAFEIKNKIDVVYHIAALVGPFHDRDKYMKVNYHGTMHILEACKKYGVPKLVNSSSPSTRFDGSDIEGLREDELPNPPKRYLALYAETKAHAEQQVTKACDPPNFMTVSVAPHQVYGPHDGLFMTKLLETCGNNRLRIFGKGDNKISVCYNDNYCHGLLCGADALCEGSPALGKFYIITDGPPQYFWKILNQAALAMGFSDLYQKFHLPTPLLYAVAYCANVVGWLIGKKFKLNPFNVRMLTMHRYFSIENAQRDLKYQPLYKFEDSWSSTIEWFRVNWLPGFLEETGRSNKATLNPTSKKD